MDASLESEAQKLTLEEPDNDAKPNDEVFNTTRDEACPETYDDTLTTILQQTSDGTCAWLAEQDDVKRWMDPADSTSRCLWLTGSPGSGKTHLTATLIRHLHQTNHPTLFAFLSHSQPQTNRDGLSILLSLLFQAVEAKPALKSMIPDPSYPDHARLLDREYDFVRDLVCSVLQAMGPVFIVLDGLDEVEEDGWREVLGAVMEVRERCGEAMVFVASREVEGMAGLGGEGVVTVRADGNNEEDIKRFVRGESRDVLLGLEKGGASEAEVLGVQVALESIAEKSGGLFIYAKLALQVIKDCKTVAEFQSEIERLPNGLDQLYAQLISRIKAKVTTQKHLEAIRSVLMLAACAGRPLRVHEVLQFLAISSGTKDFVRGQTEYPGIIEDCGPILQAVDSVVRFIHVTAKENLLSGYENGLPKLADAHLNAALTCITYLTSPSLDILFPEPGGAAGITRRILNGDFGFLTYAVTEYINHIKAWLDHKDPQDSTEAMSTALRQLLDVRRNKIFKHPIPSKTFLRDFYTPEAMDDYKHREGFSIDVSFNPEPAPALMRLFTPLGSDPALQRSLACAAAFIDAAKMGMVSVEESDNASQNDPLSIFPAFGEFRRHLEAAFCAGPDHSADCHCQKLEDLYGPQRYYCKKLLCRDYLIGFPTRAARDRHIDSHTRDFPCPDKDCYAARGGLDTRLVRSRHMLSCHDSFTCNGAPPPLHLLHDAILAHDLPTVKSLLIEGPTPLPKRHNYLQTLSFAAHHSTPAILDFLLDPDITSPYTPALPLPDLLSYALSAALGPPTPNAPIIRHLLLTLAADPLHSAPWGYGSPLGQAIATWDPVLLRLLVDECGVAIPPNHHALGAGLFSTPHLFGASVEEVRRRFREVTACLPTVGPEGYKAGPFKACMGAGPVAVRVSLENGGEPDYVGAQGWSETPLYMMVKGGGLGVAMMLLEHGADPNVMPPYPFSALFEAVNSKILRESGVFEMVRVLLMHGADPNLGKSPLWIAMRDGKARVVKMLLQHGADVEAAVEGRNLAKFEGVKKIEAYFGLPWKEIVSRIRQGEEDLEKAEVAR